MGRHTVLAAHAGIEARLTWYQPGEAMADHVHGEHQLSWLLGGEMRETSAGRERDLVQVSRGVKPAGLPHANLYGPSGALILALNIDADAPLCADLPGLADWDWSALDAQAPETLSGLMKGLADGDVSAALALPDLTAQALGAQALGETSSERSDKTRATEPWLARVREALRDDPDEPDLQALADRAGVHRVHLSRRFTRHFGLPPSLYRLRCKLGRSISSLMQGESAAEAALHGGFADQAHFTRSVRRQTGLTPRHLRALLAA